MAIRAPDGANNTTDVFKAQVGGDNVKLADLLAGVAGHLCQVTCFNLSSSCAKNYTIGKEGGKERNNSP